MEQVQILALIDEFYRARFTLADAERLVGPVLERRGNNVFLKPRAGTGYASAEVELLETKEHESFAAGLDIVLQQAIPVDFEDLQERFGAAQEQPIGHPGEPTPYRFLVRDRYELDGFFVLFVPGTAKAGTNPVVRIILNRFAPQATEAGRRMRALRDALSKGKP